MIMWHCSNQLMVPVISFIDIFLEGENYASGPLRVGEFYSKLLPADRLQAQHSGQPFGGVFPPPWLPGTEVTSSFLIQTQALVTCGRGWASSGRLLNVRKMPVGTSECVGLIVTFWAGGRQFWISFNESCWEGLDLLGVQGFAGVTREDVDTWVLRSLRADDALPGGVAGQANLFAAVPAVSGVHGAGYCDLGDWKTPFTLHLTRVH
jgi:hypothetical protein